MFPSFCVLLFFSLSVSCTSDKRREAFISANWFISLLRATSGHSASRYLAARRSTLFSTINQNIWLQSTFLEITHQFKLSVNILKAVLSADEQSYVSLKFYKCFDCGDIGLWYRLTSIAALLFPLYFRFRHNTSWLLVRKRPRFGFWHFFVTTPSGNCPQVSTRISSGVTLMNVETQTGGGRWIESNKDVMWFGRVNKAPSCKERPLRFRFVLRKQTRCVNSVNRSACVDGSFVSGRRDAAPPRKYSEAFKCCGCQRLWPLWWMLGSAVQRSLTAEMLAFPLLQSSCSRACVRGKK